MLCKTISDPTSITMMQAGVDSPPDLTTIAIKRLPNDVADIETFLDLYLLSHLGLSNCPKELVYNKASGVFKGVANIDLGSPEKAQQAIRELNNSKLCDSNISVSLCIEGYSPTPDRKVYLKGLPDGFGHKEAYDLLSKYGTIVGIFFIPSHTDKDRLYSIWALFLTEEEAKRAVEGINASRNEEQTIIAEFDKKVTTGNPEDSPGGNGNEATGDGSSSDFVEDKASDSTAGQSQQLVELLDEDATDQLDGAEPTPAKEQEKENNFPEPKDNATENSNPSQDDDRPNHTELSIVPIKQDASSQTQTVESGQSNGTIVSQRKVLDLDAMASDEERKEAIGDFLYEEHFDVIKPRKRLEKVVQVMKNSLDPHHMLENCIKTKKFKFYAQMAENALRKQEWKTIQLPTASLDVAEELDLGSLPDKEAQLDAIQDWLDCEGLGHYPDNIMKRILRSLKTSLDIPELLRLCHNEEQFRLAILNAKIAFARGTNYAKFLETDAAMSLALKLNFDKKDTFVEWRKALRDSLTEEHKERYDSERLEKILDWIFNFLPNPDDLRYLIGLQTVGFKQFDRAAFVAEIIVKAGKTSLSRDMYNSLSNLANELELCDPSAYSRHRQVFHDYLYEKYQAQYGRERWKVSLEKIFASLDSPEGSYILFEMCVTDPKRLCVYASVAEIATAKDTMFTYKVVSDAVIGMLGQLKIDTLTTLDERRQALRNYLVQSWREKYAIEKLNKILDWIFWFHDKPADFYELLETTASESASLLACATVAEIAVDTGCSIPDHAFFDSMVKLVARLNLTEPDINAKQRKILYEQMLSRHKNRIGEARLKKLLDWHFGFFAKPERLSFLAGICFSDDKKFLAYCAVIEMLMEMECSYLYLDSFELMAELALQLNLFEQGTFLKRMQVLRNHLVQQHKDRYDSKRLDEILSRMYDCYTTPRDFHKILQICTSDVKILGAYATLADVCIEKNYYYQFDRLPNSIVELIQKLQLDKKRKFDKKLQALRDHMYSQYENRYDCDRLDIALDSLVNLVKNPRDFNKLLEICSADSKLFFAYGLAASAPAEDKSLFFKHELSEAAITLVQQLNLDRLYNEADIMSALRQHLLKTYDGQLNKFDFSAFLGKRIVWQKKSDQNIALLNICAADPKTFHMYFSITWGLGIDGASFYPITTSMEELFYRLNLDKIDVFKTWKSKLNEHLAKRYKDFGTSVPQGLSGVIERSSNSFANFYALLDMCSAEKERFEQYSIIVKKYLPGHHHHYYHHNDQAWNQIVNDVRAGDITAWQSVPQKSGVSQIVASTKNWGT